MTAPEPTAVERTIAEGCTFVGLDPEATKDHESEDQ